MYRLTMTWTNCPNVVVHNLSRQDADQIEDIYAANRFVTHIEREWTDVEA